MAAGGAGAGSPLKHFKHHFKWPHDDQNNDEPELQNAMLSALSVAQNVAGSTHQHGVSQIASKWYEQKNQVERVNKVFVIHAFKTI